MQDRLLNRAWQLPDKRLQPFDHMKKKGLVHSILECRF